MTVAPSQFTLPLATLNPKVRRSGGLAVCLTTNSCPLWGSFKALCMHPSTGHYPPPSPPSPVHLPQMACLSAVQGHYSPHSIGCKMLSPCVHHMTSINITITAISSTLDYPPLSLAHTHHSRPLSLGFLSVRPRYTKKPCPVLSTGSEADMLIGCTCLSMLWMHPRKLWFLFVSGLSMQSCNTRLSNNGFLDRPNWNSEFLAPKKNTKTKKICTFSSWNAQFGWYFGSVSNWTRAPFRNDLTVLMQRWLTCLSLLNLIVFVFLF